ncbi:uncharacterized protein LOC133525053 [Cydia pomonella]|uniref:uncharacterized protein LOC133525053 n=1 Tax=Cydia pomonella TaxID=82600 RepID=UPI002ADD6E6B|nr:uncharacterized protein LOC133525053 [Cydia pomonella]
MNNFLSFIFLIVIYYTRSPIFGSDIIFDGNSKGLGFSQGFYKDRGSIGDILLNNRFDHAIGYKGQGIFERNNHKFAFDEGNPDIHGIIERPCQVYDTFCIRKFFAEHSKCKISGRRLPEPFFRAQAGYQYASANISVTAVDGIYDGLSNARVEEFYINKVTDNLIIAFYFDDVSIRSNNTNAKFYLRGREPEVHTDFASLDFRKTTVTMIIPGLNNLRLDRAETFTESPLVPFSAGPRIGLSSDPEVVSMFLYLVTAGVPVETREEISTEGVFLATTYLQYNICDFGLKVL